MEKETKIVIGGSVMLLVILGLAFILLVVSPSQDSWNQKKANEFKGMPAYGLLTLPPDKPKMKVDKKVPESRGIVAPPRKVYQQAQIGQMVDEGVTMLIPTSYPIDIDNEPDISNKSLNATEEFLAQILLAHNIYRKKHGSPPLEIDESLVEKAAEWASHLAYHDEGVSIRPNNPFGQNVYVHDPNVTQSNLTGRIPVSAWYGEIAKYVFGKEPQDQPLIINSFTQVVWKRSKYLGCAQELQDMSKKIYVVCDYNPPGNVIGSYRYNVARPNITNE